MSGAPQPSEWVTALSASGARALVVGTGHQVEGSALPDTPAVERTVRDVGNALVRYCDLDPAHLTRLIDPADPRDFANALLATAAQATDVLLIYFIGHGLVHETSGQLYLATRSTKDYDETMVFNALPYAVVRQILTSSCPANSIVVVLDCCYSGRAGRALGPETEEALAAAEVQGSYLLTASASDQLALAPEGEPHTAFSGELLRLLTDGDTQTSEWLTLDLVHRHLKRRMEARGLPLPRRLSSGHADDLVLARNRATRAKGIHPLPDIVERAPGIGEICPYRGLSIFSSQDARYFFGRGRLVSAMVERLGQRLPGAGPMVVTGPSGSGKSSAVLAGLIPALRRGTPQAPDAGGWPVMTYTPGAEPSRELAEQLARAGTADENRTATELAADPGWLAVAARRYLHRRFGVDGAAGRRLLLVVDQFEQLFSAGAESAEIHAFIRAICGLCTTDAAGEPPPGVVVITVRADFYGHCAGYPELVPALQDGHVVAGPLTRAELIEVIERPAAAVGLALEDGLVDVLLQDLSRRPADGATAGALPLLSHALLATWQHRRDRRLTLAGYRTTGGLWEAVAHTAEETYASLPATEKATAQWLLPRLVRVSDLGEHTRRIVPAAELKLGEGAAGGSRGEASVGNVMHAFTQARLFTVDDQGVQIAHEALLHAWPRLGTLLDENRADLLFGQSLDEAARAWDQEGREDGALYRASRLVAAREWLATSRREVPATTRGFVEASIAREDAERRARRRSARRRRIAAVGALVAVILVVGLVLNLIAISRDDARRGAFELRQRKSDAAFSLLFEAESARDDQVELALRLGLAGATMSPGRDTRASLVETMAGVGFRGQVSDEPGDVVAISDVATSPGRGLMAVASRRAVSVRSIEQSVGGGQTILSGAPLPTEAEPTTLAVCPGYVAAGGSDGSVVTWRLAGSARPEKQGTLDTRENAAVKLAMSGAGCTLAVGGANGVTIWAPDADGTPLRSAQLGGFPKPVSALALSPDGRQLAVAAGGRLDLWQLADGARPQARRTAAVSDPEILSLSYHPAGRQLAAGRSDGSIAIWDAADARLSAVVHNSPDPVSAVAFHRFDDVIIAGSSEGGLNRWDVTNPRGPFPLSQQSVGRGPVVDLAHLGSDRLRGDTAVVSGDGKLTYWGTGSLAAPTAETSVVTGGPPAIQGGVMVSPGGPHVFELRVPNDERLTAWSGPTKASQASTLPGTATRPQPVAVNPAGTKALSGGAGGSMVLWDIQDRAKPRRLSTLKRTGDGPAVGTFSPDGRTVAVSAPGAGTVQLWDIFEEAEPREVGRIDVGGPIAPWLAFQPGGRVLATGADGRVVFWDVGNRDSPAVAGTALTGVGLPRSAAFSSGGEVVAIAGKTSLVGLWDVGRWDRGPKPLGEIPGEPGVTHSVSFAAHAPILATGADGAATLWDATDPSHPRRLATAESGRRPLVAVAFADSKTSAALAITDDRGKTTFWTFGRLMDVVNRPLDFACEIVGRGLDATEWPRFVDGVPYQRSCPN